MNIITLRRGETVRDDPTGTLITLDEEVLRLSLPDGSGCPYLQTTPLACTIHGSHPLECRVLSCTDPRALMDIYTTNRLQRVDLLGEESELIAAARYHDETFPAKHILDIARRIAKEIKHGMPKDCRQDIETLTDIASRERAFRMTLLEHTQIPSTHLPFLLGRSIPTLVTPLGLKLS